MGLCPQLLRGWTPELGPYVKVAAPAPPGNPPFVRATLPATEIEKVFTPFYRLERSRSRDTGGVGLGLAVARAVIREHGGDITLSNRPTGGLRQTVVLPRR